MENQKNFMWATLVHLGTNMWREEGNKAVGEHTWMCPASSDLRFDQAVWDEYIEKLREAGNDTIILDLGDGICYESHPELAIRGSWSREKTEAELKKLHDMGFEVIPKLNFSTTHDVWMKEYSKMVSTETYYSVCKDLIDEVCELFKPRYFHIGMDEERYELQRDYDYVVLRQNDAWWHDFYYYVDCVEKNNARAIVFSDYARDNPEEYVKKCPKSVVQSVWYYQLEFSNFSSESCERRVRPFEILDKAGFDILPTGSVAYHDENMEALTKYCAEHISREHLLGFMQTTWESVEEKWAGVLDTGVRTLKASKQWYENQR